MAFNRSERNEYDAIVIGGGPAGSTTAALLAQYGHRVLLLEREAFPRYHVGESLIPYTWFTFERLGLVDRLKNLAWQKKYSVQFVSLAGGVSQPFYFFETIEHECAVTWQVLRSEFDALLLENARETGVEVRQRVAARGLLMDGARAVGVQYRAGNGEGEARARVTIDATGRDALLATRFGWRRRDPDLNKVSLWTYFKGAVRDAGLDEGATTVAAIPEKGWFWYLPLAGDLVSVGVVGEPAYLYRDGRNPDDVFAREAQACGWIREHLRTGRQVEPVRVTGEYSYHSDEFGGDGFCLVGDAFSFLDPLFSTGLFLALKGGELAADAVHAALDAGDVSAVRFAEYGARQRAAVRAFRNLVTAFYEPTFSFREFLDVHPHLQPLIVDTLVGNVFKDLTPLFDALAAYVGRGAAAHRESAS